MTTNITEIFHTRPGTKLEQLLLLLDQAGGKPRSMASLTRDLYGKDVPEGLEAQSWWRTDRSAAGLRRRIEENHLPYELVSGPGGLALRRL